MAKAATVKKPTKKTKAKVAVVAKPDMSHPIKLGNTVRDLLTGFEGIATCYVEMLNASRHYIVEPKVVTKNKSEDSQSFGVNRLYYVDDGVVDNVPEIDNTCVLELGHKAKDKASGFEGILTEKVLHINGCITFLVTGEAKDSREKPIVLNFNHKMLEKTGNGVHTPAQVEFQAKPPEQRPCPTGIDASIYVER